MSVILRHGYALLNNSDVFLDLSRGLTKLNLLGAYLSGTGGHGPYQSHSLDIKMLCSLATKQYEHAINKHNDVNFTVQIQENLVGKDKQHTEEKGNFDRFVDAIRTSPKLYRSQSGKWSSQK